MFKSSLHDERTFYQAFSQDLLRAEREVVIESPFVTRGRMKEVFPLFQKLVDRGVKVFVMTRNPSEHMGVMADQAELEIQRFEALGVQVLICTGSHHRKLAIIDRTILWEGSLNILSHSKSREIMRRIDGVEFAQEMFQFLRLERFIK